MPLMNSTISPKACTRSIESPPLSLSRTRQLSAMGLPRGHRPPPWRVHLLAVLCFVALKTAAAAPRTGSTGGGIGIASITDMGMKDAISAKYVLRKDPVNDVIALKESMKYFDADFFNDSKVIFKMSAYAFQVQVSC